MITIKLSILNFKYHKPVKQWFMAFVIFALCANISFAQQQQTVSGNITSGGIPLGGVNVIEKGTSNGVQSDFDGNYSISVNQGSTLVFSFIGFATQEILINNQSQLNVTMEEDLTSLDEVVVVGYGTQKKSDLTGSVSLVDTDEMVKQATNDVAQMMQGRVAGVSITTDGQPGANPNVRIRGVATFGGSDAEPLYVVDGFTITGGIRDINPNDIESIQVLKDASAGAIYGNRAANGVIIITTKSGRKGQKFSVEINSYYGVQTVGQRLPILDREGYQMINAELLTNAGEPIVPGNDPNSPLFIDDIDTDWQDEGYKDGYITNHNVNFSGGTENTNYFVSMDYLDNEGTLVGSGPAYKRYSFRVNTDTQMGKFNFGENIYLMHSDEDPLFFPTTISLPGGRPSLVNDLLQAAPTIPVNDPNRLGGFGGADSNIHQSITLNVPGINTLIENRAKVNRILANFYAAYEFTDGLTFKTSLQYDNTTVEDELFVPQYDLGYFFPGPTAQYQVANRTNSSFLIENTLNWVKTIGKHDFTVLLGQTYQKNNSRNVRVIGAGLEAPYVQSLTSATSFSVTDGQGPNSLSSFLGRVTYSFDDTYLLTGNIRRDGSSKFAKDLRFEYFPSVGLGIKLQNQFDLPDFIRELKLRGAIGEVGNQEIGNFRYQGTVNRGIPYSFSYGRAIGAAVSTIVNKGIKWETRVTRSVGIDASLWNGGLDFTVEYYSNTSNDVLTSVGIPGAVGSIPSSIFTNAGSIKNSGIELSAVIRKQFGDFNIEVAPNFYTLKNEVLEIGNPTGLINSGGARTVVGRSLGEHYGWVYDGLFQTDAEVAAAPFQTPGTAPGDIKYVDLNNDNVINDDDRKFLGKGLPTYYYGINISGSYKNFDFTIFGQGSGGNLINSNLYRGLMPTSSYTNWHEDILNRWTPTNTDTDVPRVIFLNPNNNSRNSNRPGWLQKGDYFRLNTISLGYSLPESVISKMHLEKARFYVTLQNVAVFSEYKGYNPDFNSGILNPGFDYGTFPRPMTSMLGVQLKF